MYLDQGVGKVPQPMGTVTDDLVGLVVDGGVTGTFEWINAGFGV